MFESLQESIGVLAEGQQAIRDELDNFKEDTSNNFKAIFEYLSHIDKELVEIMRGTKK